MYRHWSLIKDILEVAEACQGKIRKFEEFYPEKFNRRLGENPDLELTVRYQVRLLLSEKYILAYTSPDEAVESLTWRGHNLLDELREIAVPRSAMA